MNEDDGTSPQPNRRIIADVAVDQARPGGREALSYAVPTELEETLAVGQLVWVPLRKQTVLAIVLDVHSRDIDLVLRPINAAVEPTFCLTASQLRIAEWLAHETVCGLYAAASPFLPPGVTHRAVEHLSIVDGSDLSGLTSAQHKLATLLAERGEMTAAAARTSIGSSLASVIPKLEAKGVIRRQVRVVDRAPGLQTDRFVRLSDRDLHQVGKSPRQQAVVDYLVQRARLTSESQGDLTPLSELLARTGTDTATVGALARKGVIEEVSRLRGAKRIAAPQTPAPNLTQAQAAVWMELEQALLARDSTPCLIHGVTGSGKTEIYLRGTAWAIARDLDVIVLVPEIALASQVVRRFEARFPEQVAVLHSALSDSERYRTWQAVARGERRIVVGPRSALFAPVQHLGLIVIDEEQEPAYKQESEPRYQARILAELMAEESRAVLVLGTATPSVETAWRAETGSIRRVELAERIPDAVGTALALPDVEIVDMRLELHRGNTSLLSESLQAAVEDVLAAGEQAMLLLNRRGTATVVICRSCGSTLMCPQCDVPLVYHGDRGRLMCHRCNHREIPLQRCPECAGPLSYHGAGTQRVEAEVQRRYPEARVLRWDQDSVKRAGGHERLLGKVERREVDIVVGTQMIAKGLDLPMVTAVGVVHADTMLHLPDFRSGERTFQLLTQVAGRAGRRAPGSMVVIQTYSPGHYAIQAASRHDYDAFYAEEIAFRKVHRYPPFVRLARYHYRHENEETCAAEAEEMARRLARHARLHDVPADLLGPAPAFASKVRGKHQWQMVLRASPGDFEELLDDLPIRPGWSVDVDPQSML